MCHPEHRAVLIISHDTPTPTATAIWFSGEKNPACMALKLAFIYHTLDPPHRTVIIYLFIIIDPKLWPT